MTNLKQRKVTPEVLAMMVDLLPEIRSLRDLCAVTGLRLDTVRKEVAPFLAIMKLTGTHPQCGCGRDRFHPYGCVDSWEKSDRSEHVPGYSKEDAKVLLERRAGIVAMIMTGAFYGDIDRAFGMNLGMAKKYKRFLTPDQVATRKALERDRPSRPRGPARSAGGAIEYRRPFSDPLYARIASAVPRTMSEALRDDVISEIYVAVSSGEMADDAIEREAKRFANAAIGQFESKWGPRPIDQPMFDDGRRTLADIIPDPSALAAFARLDDLQLGRRRAA